MKKLILSLFIFCSAFASAQISIPQVTGLPAALNSKVDKVTGKSLVADTLSAKIQPTATAVAAKEPLLPSTPTNPESRFLNGNKQWAEIVLGSGGYASNVYFTNLTSAIVGTYKQTSATHEFTETIASGTCNNNEVLIHTYLFEQPVGITTVDAGVWRFTMNSKINSSVGDSKFKIVQFKRSSTGVETDMFTIYSNTIENTDYQNFIIETVQPSFLVDSLDRFGCRIYATTTTTVNKIISYKVGDGFASYLNTPLALRHPQLRDPNGNPNVQHLTAAQVTKVNNTSGINTGDETLTSIKTKLGAATAVSDGYLKYQDFALLHAPTTVTASNGLSISGQNISLQNASLTQSGALTFNDWNTFNSKEPAITKNSGFNLPLGNTTGTVLEGRTFGTAANSAVGDFVQISPFSSQSGNIKISGIYDFSPNPYFKSGASGFRFNDSSDSFNNFVISDNGNTSTRGAGTFGSTVNSTGFLLNGNNLTSSLTTNYIPKWNGSSFVNSLISDDGTCINTFGQLDTNLEFKAGSNRYLGFGSKTNWNYYLASSEDDFRVYDADGTDFIKLFYGSGVRRVSIPLTTPSTSPTTGALVVGGGVGADHVRANNFYGSGSNLTGVQLPITLTTNGTSGAATFSGNVLNVPNYGSGDIGINQTQTVINGSGGGSMTCSELFNGVAYKKVLITVVGLSGTATYTFPNSFSAGRFYTTFVTGISGYTVTNSSFSFTSGAGTTGCIIIEGY